jgi:SAM-dependent methyltransferase
LSPIRHTLRRALDRFLGPAGTPVQRADPPAEDQSTLDTADAAALFGEENRGAISLERASDLAEAETDERQDLNECLNFPLHWTSTRLTSQYLFDFAIALELLGARPDDRVLDVAAGTCWASEMLTRLGVRPVSMDLSVEMMRRGRARLHADSRIVFRDLAGFVAGRGQSLPFRDETFDGVLCMNALHHLPSYAEALREIYRVLKPGGRAVFSEPGTAHAEEALSQFRMREERVLEKSVSLHLIRRLARDAGFTRIRAVPLRSPVGYVFDYGGPEENRASLDRMWTETRQLAAREHARFVLCKGDDPPADTLLPTDKLTGRIRAHIVLADVQPEVKAGESFTDRLRVTNAGSVTWKARGRRFGGQVTCGIKIYGATGDLLREDLGRTAIPRDVPPGDTIEIEVAVNAALAPARYTVRYDMVVEGVTWFEFQGSDCPTRPLMVRD